MGLLGGSRVDGITMFIGVTLVVYSILVAGVYATFTEVGYIDPYGGKAVDLNLAQDYEFNDIENVTLGDWTEFSGLDPDRRIIWNDSWLGSDWFSVYRYGVNWWDGWLTFRLEPDEIYVSEVLTLYDSDLNYSKVVFDLGSNFETAVFFCPLFHYNETGVTYIDSSLSDSIDNEVITVVMATNASYASYDIGHIMGALTGFSTYDMPSELGSLTGGIFWMLLILLVVKLVVG